MARPTGSKNRKKQHNWSNEEKEYLKSIAKGKTTKEILNLMNEKFEYEFSLTQIRSAMNRYKLKNEVDCRIKKGSTPWNKGIKGYMGANKTSFKKGNIPAQYREVGSERINKDGLIEVKVKDPNIWKHKHRYIYEQNIGEIKKGNVIIFLDGNNRNFSTDNLIQVTRNQLLTLNKYKLIACNGDLTKAGINTANLIIKLNEIKKGKINK